MNKNILIRTNAFVCGIIILGFLLTSLISYHSNLDLFEEDIVDVSNLASEGIYYRIKLIFAEPVNVSVTMANDSLLKDFLENEESMLDDEEFIQRMREYLNAYHKKYHYDSVFLVSTQTSRYYHIKGLDRILTKENPENEWYYDFINNQDEYSLNVDNDEAANNEITIFINCKIHGKNGAILGVVGVGFRVNYLQEMLKKYEDMFGVQTCLVDSNGIVEISPQKTGYEKSSWFGELHSSVSKDQILQSKENIEALWVDSPKGRSYVVARYVQNLNWYLIVQNNTSQLSLHLNQQAYKNILVILLIVIAVLLIITHVIQQYNTKIIALTAEQQRAYYEKRQETIQQIYENIYDIDITHDCAADAHTENYFESLGISKDTPFSKALLIIAEKQIKPDYQQDYIDIFSPKKVFDAYNNGIKNLSCDCIISNDAQYYWMRITACIYFLSETQSIHMTTYRQNIDEEKKHERKLITQMQSDPLTGLYNKAATEELASDMLAASSNELCAFFIIDIDNFKQVNDTSGHAVGDYVITSFAHLLKEQFRDADIVGRIGGDEFVVLLKIPSRYFMERKAKSLVEVLCSSISTDTWRHSISASIGVSLFPEHGNTFFELYKKADAAMYKAKRMGKNGYTIFS